MANIFAITTVTENIQADAAGAARAVFTVTNNLGRSVRGMAGARALENTQQNWLDIEGETERDFPVGGTQQFIVNFHKPAAQGGTAAKFPFRLDVASSSNPDEEFTEGPTVTVEIVKAMLPSAKSFPWWIILVAAVVLVLVGGLTWFFVFSGKNDNANVNSNRPAPTPAPNLAGNWVSVDAPSESAPIAKMEVKRTDGRLKVLFPPFDAPEHLLEFDGEIKPDGTGEVEGPIARGYVKIKLEIVAPDRLLVLAYYYPGEDAQGKPNQSYKQVLTRR